MVMDHMYGDRPSYLSTAWLAVIYVDQKEFQEGHTHVFIHKFLDTKIIAFSQRYGQFIVHLQYNAQKSPDGACGCRI